MFVHLERFTVTIYNVLRSFNICLRCLSFRCLSLGSYNGRSALCGNLRRSQINRGPTAAAAAAAAASRRTILSAERRCSLTFQVQLQLRS